MISVDVSKARKEFPATIKSVWRGERIALERHGKRVAALVSIEDLEFLQALEDAADIRDARRARREAELHGTISHEALKAKLGF